MARRVSGFSVTRWVRACSALRRFIEPDVSVGTQAEDLEVDAAGSGDGALVAGAFLDRIRRRAVEEIDLLRPELDAIEEVGVHEAAIAGGVARREAPELVEIEGRHAREVGAPVLGERREVVIETHRRAPGRQAEHERRTRRESVGDVLRERPGGGAVVRKDRDARGARGTRRARVANQGACPASCMITR